TWRRRWPGSPTWVPYGSRPGAKGAHHGASRPTAKQILRAFGAQDDGLTRSRKEMMKPTRRVILSERAVRARSEGSVAFGPALGPLPSGRVQLGVHGKRAADKARAVGKHDGSIR